MVRSQNRTKDKISKFENFVEVCSLNVLSGFFWNPQSAPIIALNLVKAAVWPSGLYGPLHLDPPILNCFCDLVNWTWRNSRIHEKTNILLLIW